MKKQKKRWREAKENVTEKADRDGKKRKDQKKSERGEEEKGIGDRVEQKRREEEG